MTYQAKPGTFTLFKNERKEKDSQPDYRGDGADHDGNPIEVAAWLKKSANGKTFMSCNFKPKEARPETGRERQERKAAPPADDGFDSDLPF